MFETVIPRGSVTILIRKVHGFLNCRVTPYDSDEWFFKQFGTRSEAEEYALKHSFTIADERKFDDDDNGA